MDVNLAWCSEQWLHGCYAIHAVGTAHMSWKHEGSMEGVRDGYELSCEEMQDIWRSFWMVVLWAWEWRTEWWGFGRLWCLVRAI